jgi:hypothetical protein
MVSRWFALGLTGAALACGDGTGPDLTLALLAGTWTATDVSVTNNLDPSLSEDLYALGVRFQIDIGTDGAFAVEFSNPLGSDGYDGTLTVEGDSVILTSPDLQPARMALHAKLEGEALALAWVGTEQCGSYEWEADDCPIPVTFAMRLERD